MRAAQRGPRGVFSNQTKGKAMTTSDNDPIREDGFLILEAGAEYLPGQPDFYIKKTDAEAAAEKLARDAIRMRPAGALPVYVVPAVSFGTEQHRVERVRNQERRSR